MRDRRLMNLIAERHQGAKVRKEQTPSGDRSIRTTIVGIPRSFQNTTIDQVTMRQQTTLRGKKIKPSMPKMPWD